MSRLTRDRTVEPVSRDQILRHARGQGNIIFPCSADHEQDWQLYPVDPYSAICDDHTYIHSTHACHVMSCGIIALDETRWVLLGLRFFLSSVISFGKIVNPNVALSPFFLYKTISALLKKKDFGCKLVVGKLFTDAAHSPLLKVLFEKQKIRGNSMVGTFIAGTFSMPTSYQ